MSFIWALTHIQRYMVNGAHVSLVSTHPALLCQCHTRCCTTHLNHTAVCMLYSTCITAHEFLQCLSTTSWRSFAPKALALNHVQTQPLSKLCSLQVSPSLYAPPSCLQVTCMHSSSFVSMKLPHVSLKQTCAPPSRLHLVHALTLVPSSSGGLHASH